MTISKKTFEAEVRADVDATEKWLMHVAGSAVEVDVAYANAVTRFQAKVNQTTHPSGSFHANIMARLDYAKYLAHKRFAG